MFRLAMMATPLGNLAGRNSWRRCAITPRGSFCLTARDASAKRPDFNIGGTRGRVAVVAIHDFCESHGIPVWCGGMLESGIGRAYNVALASLPNFTKPGDVSPSARYWERDVVTPEWTMTPDGRCVVPLHRPGIGVAVDRDRIDDLTVRMETLGE
jgi:O-succinylbenzoate synthase